MKPIKITFSLLAASVAFFAIGAAYDPRVSQFFALSLNQQPNVLSMSGGFLTLDGKSLGPISDTFIPAWSATGWTNSPAHLDGNGNVEFGPLNATIVESRLGSDPSITLGDGVLWSENGSNSKLTINGTLAGYVENDLFAGSVAFGYGSSYGLAASANTAYGALALSSITTGANDTAIGEGALASITSPSADTALGQFAGHAITTGDNNVLIGRDTAAFSIGGASLQNTIIGALAGNSVGTRTNVIVLGYNASAATTANSATIGNSSVSSIWLGGNVAWYVGTGTPEGSISAPVGSFYSRLDGGANTSFYVKEPGTSNTGWVGK